MKKILTIAIVIFSIFILTSCDNKNNEEESKIYLDSKFYNKSEYIKIGAEDFNLINDKAFVLFTYNSYCTLSTPCDTVFKETMDKYNLSFYSIPVHEMRNTYIYETVKYAPSIIIVNNKKVIAYLDAESDEDYIRYQDSNEFEKWLGKYIYLEK